MCHLRIVCFQSAVCRFLVTFANAANDHDRAFYSLRHPAKEHSTLSLSSLFKQQAVKWRQHSRVDDQHDDTGTDATVRPGGRGGIAERSVQQQ